MTAPPAKRGPGRPPKAIDDHVREGTFRPARHAGRVEAERGVTLEQLVRTSPRNDRRWRRNPQRHFQRFAGLCKNTRGRWRGTPLDFYREQLEFQAEALRIDPVTGQRVYRRAVKGIARKNGKSTEAAALALYLAGPEGEPGPEVICAAGSKEQASIVFGQAREFVEFEPLLGAWYRPMQFSITCPAVGGILKRVAADGKLQHGLNPSGVVIDELHSFLTPRQVETYKAVTTGSGAREEPLTAVITTAGFDLDSLLGTLYTAALEAPARFVEERPGLVIVRNTDARFLLWWHSAPEGCDPEDPEAIKLANPAPWVTVERVLEELHSPDMDEATFRRLHLNQWTEARDPWITQQRWRALRGEAKVTRGDAVYVMVDVGITHDSTAVVFAKLGENGRKVIRSHVIAADPKAPAHRHVRDRVPLSIVEEHVRALAYEHGLEVRMIGYDPRFFERSAEALSDEGFTVVPLEPGSDDWAQATTVFYQGYREGMLEHDGDDVLEKHATGAQGDRTERGWRVRKLRTDKRIDALTAAIGAVYLADTYGRWSAGVESADDYEADTGEAADPWADDWDVDDEPEGGDEWD